MKKNQLIIISITVSLLVFCLGSLASAAPLRQEQDLKMPDHIQYDGREYIRDASWKDYEKILLHDIDGSGVKEVIMRFRANPQDGNGFPRAFTVIYRPGDKIPRKIIRGGETPSDTRFFDITGDKIDDLILYDYSGNHYTTIMIYSFKNGDYECLFKNGTACYVHDVETDKRPVRIVIGRENWDNKDFCYGTSDTKSLLEVWEWNGSKFVYAPKQSTSSLTSEKEALEKAWQVMKKVSDSTNKNQDINIKEAEFCSKAWIAGGRLEDFISDQ